MNLYFLVEGKRTEPKIYPSWLSELLPNHRRVDFADEAISNHYYLISGKGYDRLLDVTLINAIEEIREHGSYDYLVIVVDADDFSVEERMNEVLLHRNMQQSKLGNCRVQVVVQNCCIETWLLGNRKVFSRTPQDTRLRQCIAHFDVYADDPEMMFASTGYKGNRADYHLHYLTYMLRERGLKYSKNWPRETQKPHYLQQLRNRVMSEPTHLQSFRNFIQFCDAIT